MPRIRSVREYVSAEALPAWLRSVPLAHLVRWGVILCLAMVAVENLDAQSVSLGWTASTDPTAAGYNLYWGTSSGEYSGSVDVGTNTTFTVTNLTVGNTYYFAATSYDTNYEEGPFSTEISSVVQV